MKKTLTIRKKLIVSTVIIIYLCAIWVLSFNAALAHVEPKIITYVENTSYPVPEPVYIEVEKPVPVVTTIEVDKPVIIEKEIEVLHEVPVALKDWDSPEQLAAFLKNDDTNQLLILRADNSGNIEFNGKCGELALQLRDRAMAIGRYLSVQVLNPAEYEKWYGQAVGPEIYHAICMARIGNELWYIEPSNDKQWLALHIN
jgi:hypothetical protein